MAFTIADATKRRCIGLVKLAIDARIPILNSSFGWNLMTGIPHQCKTVGDFKTYLSTRYIPSTSTFNLFVDQFCIGDEEDCEIFTLLNEPVVRVISVLDKFGPMTSTPISTRAAPPIMKNNAIQENFDRPSLRNSIRSLKHIYDDVRTDPTKSSALSTSSWTTITSGAGNGEKSKLSLTKGRRKESPFGTATSQGFDEVDIPLVDNQEQYSSFHKPISPPIGPTKSRIFGQRGLQNKAAFSEILNAISFTHDEPQGISTGSRGSVPRKQTNATDTIQKLDSYSDCLRDLENPSKTLPSITGSKRNRTVSEELQPLKMHRSSLQQKNSYFGHPSLENEDTPRVQKSDVNTSTLIMFRGLEFINGTSERSPTRKTKEMDNMKNTFKKLVKNVEISETNGKGGDEISLSTHSKSQPMSLSRLLQRTKSQSFEVSDLSGTTVTRGSESSGPSFYDTLQPLTSIDDISENSIIAFKIFELGENYKGRVSEYKEAVVLGKTDIELILEECLRDDSIIPSEKFEVGDYTSDGWQNSRSVDFTLLIGPKLVRPPLTAEASINSRNYNHNMQFI